MLGILFLYMERVGRVGIAAFTDFTVAPVFLYRPGIGPDPETLRSLTLHSHPLEVKCLNL